MDCLINWALDCFTPKKPSNIFIEAFMLVCRITKLSMQSTRSFLLGKQTQTGQTNLILKTPDAYPKRPKSAVLTSGERLTKAKK